MGITEQVLAAFAAGAVTRKEIAAATGIDPSVVDATVDVLVRTGQMDVRTLKSACASGGCGNCAEDTTCKPLLQIGSAPTKRI